jgi:hypothetical protein
MPSIRDYRQAPSTAYRDGDHLGSEQRAARARKRDRERVLRGRSLEQSGGHVVRRAAPRVREGGLGAWCRGEALWWRVTGPMVVMVVVVVVVVVVAAVLRVPPLLGFLASHADADLDSGRLLSLSLWWRRLAPPSPR